MGQLVYKPQDNTSLELAVEDAISIAKALSKSNIYGVVNVEFSDIKFVVDERSSLENILKEVFLRIKNKYKVCGGLSQYPSLNNTNHWMDDFLK